MSDIMIVPGFKLLFSNPLISYGELETAIKEHNDSALPGEKYWGILFENECYSVYEYGEVPIEPEKPEPVVPDEPTVSEIKQNKIYEMSKECEDTIYDGIDVELTTGKKHFSLQINDQTNINGIFSAVTIGVTKYPYHADGEPCTMFSAEDIVTLYVAYKQYVTLQTTYNNALRRWIEREPDVSVVQSIKYGAQLPDDLQKEIVSILRAANAEIQTIVKKLSTAIANNEVEL